MTALFKSTIILCPVIFLQFLALLCRWHHADVLGLAKDGVVVVAGVVTVYEASASPALLYAILCFSGFFYDAVVSLQWMGFLMNTRIGYANFKGVGAILELVLVASAPIVSAVGAVLAGRIYFLARATRAELHPFAGCAHEKGAACTKDSAAPQSVPEQCGMMSWPTAPTQPAPPLSIAEPSRSPPFRAIFGTPLPKSPRQALAERAPVFFPEEIGSVL